MKAGQQVEICGEDLVLTEFSTTSAAITNANKAKDLVVLSAWQTALLYCMNS